MMRSLSQYVYKYSFCEAANILFDLKWEIMGRKWENVILDK